MLIAFALFGFAVYLWLMACVGYAVALCLDFKRGFDRFMRPIDTSMNELVALMAAFDMRDKP